MRPPTFLPGLAPYKEANNLNDASIARANRAAVGSSGARLLDPSESF